MIEIIKMIYIISTSNSQINEYVNSIASVKKYLNIRPYVKNTQLLLKVNNLL